MSNWSEIRNAFIEWANKNNVEYDENIENSRYAMMRSDEFRTFIVEYSDEDAMDTFKATNKDDLATSREKEAEERARLEEEGEMPELEDGQVFANIDMEEESEDVAHDMVNNFLAGLDSRDEKDKAIIAKIDTDGDGKISAKERDNLEDKIIEKGFDGNTDDLSFRDVKQAISNMENGDFEFLEDSTAVGGTTDTTTTDTTTTDTTTTNATTTDTTTTDTEAGLGDGGTEVTNEALIALDLTDYEPQIAKNNSDYGTANLSKVKDFKFDQSYSNKSVSELTATRTNVENAISEAQGNFGLYKTQYTNANATMMSASNFISANEQAYNNIIQNQFANNENIQNLNTQIQTHESTIEQSTAMVESLGATKDSLNASLNSVEGAIAGLREQCTVAKTVNKYASDGTTVIGTKTVYELDQATYNQRLAELRAEEDRIKQELTEVADQLLEQEQIINSTNEQLQLAYTNLEEQIRLTGFFETEEGQLMEAVIQNKQVYSQAKADMASAQAGMTAMDAYIVSLAAECDEIEEAIEVAKEKEEAEVEAGKYADGEAEPSDFTDENGNPMNFSGSEQIPEGGKLKNIEFDENGKLLSYEIEVDGYTITATFEDGKATYKRDLGEGYLDETLTLNADDTMKFGAGDIQNYYTQNADGSYTTEYPITDSEGNTYTQSITSKKDDNNNEVVEIKITDANGNVVQHQTRTIKHEIGSGSYGKKYTYITTVKDEIAGTTTTITDINDGSVEHTSICNTEYADGKTEEHKTVSMGDNITCSTTTTKETHYTGGSQGGAQHTLTTTVDNLTGEKTVENRTVASSANGTTETVTITKYDADGNIIETKTYKDGQEVVQEVTTYDENGKPTETINYDENGNPVSTTKYNSDGSSTTTYPEKTGTDPWGGNTTETTRRTDNPDGSIVVTTWVEHDYEEKWWQLGASSDYRTTSEVHIEKNADGTYNVTSYYWNNDQEIGVIGAGNKTTTEGLTPEQIKEMYGIDV